jgi:hypothetical protein
MKALEQSLTSGKELVESQKVEAFAVFSSFKASFRSQDRALQAQLEEVTSNIARLRESQRSQELAIVTCL